MKGKSIFTAEEEKKIRFLIDEAGKAQKNLIYKWRLKK